MLLYVPLIVLLCLSSILPFSGFVKCLVWSVESPVYATGLCPLLGGLCCKKSALISLESGCFSQHVAEIVVCDLWYWHVGALWGWQFHIPSRCQGL